jgi:XTP/dITP diphosphohydrolase
MMSHQAKQAAGRTLIFATANPHKLEEVMAMMPRGVAIKSLSDVGFTGDIPETGATLQDNALQKARHIFERYRLPCFADDTGLEVNALNGAPGVYSARYAGVDGSQSEKSKANMNRLLDALSGVTDRRARFRTVIAYMDARGREHLFEGAIAGVITTTPAGSEGFGYDPVFLPDGYRLTFALMPLAQKNQISHRGQAFKKFAEAIGKDEALYKNKRYIYSRSVPVWQVLPPLHFGEGLGVRKNPQFRFVLTPKTK